MVKLCLRFLGQFQVTRGEHPITAFESDKVRALLAYLAVEAAHAHSRSTLTALLWPDYEETSARTNLRQALYQLRLVIGDVDSSPTLLLINRQTLQFNPAAAYNLDVTTFTTLLQHCAGHTHAQLEQCDACLRRLRQAVDLYQGEFLTGFTINDSVPFEEWRRIKQEQFHLQTLDALTTLADVDEATGELERAQRYVRRQLTLEPWREEAHRQLMRLLAQQGQRAAALAQYQTCREVLAIELEVEPSAETTFLYKQIRAGNFPVKPMAAWSQAYTGHLRTAVLVDSQAVSAAVTPHNLPAQPTPFVGRTRELTELLAQLQRPDLRLLTLVGPGGMGKTRLALELGRLLAERAIQCTELSERSIPHSALRIPHFPDGIFFVSLAPLDSGDALAPAIAAAIGLELHDSDPGQALLKFLRTKQMLLILDNVEHLRDAAQWMAALIQSAPQLQIITTSRVRLNLHGEYFYHVPPLALGSSEMLSDRPDADAIRLFAQSAQRIHPGVILNAANRPAILRICQLVEGMPLGIEMAAAWSEWLSLPEIASEIEKSSDFLTADWADAPPRQRSLRAIFEWSWKLLDEHERRAFRALSVFRGGFTRQAADQVAGASLRTLIGLVNKSLLYVTPLQEGATRYQIHELLRQFAAEQLDARPDERSALAIRHSDYYLTYLADRERRLARDDPRQAATEIQNELDNVRQAWLYAVHALMCALLDKGVGGLARYYDAVGLLNESIQMLGQAATMLETTGPTLSAGPQTCPSDRPLLSKLLAIQAAALVKQGKFDDGLAIAQKALSLGATYGGIEGEIYGQMVVGQGLYRQGRYEEAQVQFENLLSLIAHYQPQKATLELLNDAEYTAQVWLGGIQAEVGDFGAAKAHFREGIHLCQLLNKRRSEVHARINLANLYRRMYDDTTARQLYEECLQIARNLGYHWGEGEVQVELGDVVRRLGEYTLANELCLRAEALLKKSGYTLEQTYSHITLARLHCCLGNYEQAHQWLDQASNAFLLQGSSWLKAVGLSVRTLLAQCTGDSETALISAQEAVQLGQLLQNPQFQAEGLLLLGHTQLHLQHWAAARQSYQQANALYAQLGNRAVAAEAQAGLALLVLATGANEEALVSVDKLLPLLQQENTIGLDEPFGVCLACYRILVACQDRRAATVLACGHKLLHRYMTHIQDETWRRSFLENVPVHRALYQACISSGLKPLLV